MNPVHYMNSNLQNSFSSPTGAPFSSNSQPGSTSSMAFFAQPELSSQSTLHLPHGQFQYSVPPSNHLPVSSFETVRGVNGLTGKEMVLLNQDNLNRLRDLIAACRANPNILYMPGLTFFKEYLESLRAKIPTPKVEEEDDQNFVDFDDSPAIDIEFRDDNADRIHQCKLCNKKYKGIGDLRKHMKMHKGDMPFKCNQCDKGFISNKYLKRHMISHTGADGTFKCNQCDKTFAHSSSLDYHIRAHNGVKPHSCTECGKSFSQKSRLLTHMRTHTGERPYKCNQCEKTFKQYNAHKMHMFTHTDERPYQCSQCDKSFRVRDQLTKHTLRKHTPRDRKKYECPECDKTFLYNISLTRHMKVHPVVIMHE